METKAEESYQVQKARKKLAKQLEKEHKLINKKAIDQMKKAIQIWIGRHQDERVKLKERVVELFDENRHSAPEQSEFVIKLMRKLKKEEKATEPTSPLAGRVKK